MDIVDDEAGRRYEAYQDGSRAGHITYEARPDGVRVLLHTEVEPAFRGRGVGAALVSGVLEAVRARGARVVPVCPFVRRYLDQHPEDRDLVVPGDTAK